MTVAKLPACQNADVGSLNKFRRHRTLRSKNKEREGWMKDGENNNKKMYVVVIA